MGHGLRNRVEDEALKLVARNTDQAFHVAEKPGQKFNFQKNRRWSVPIPAYVAHK
jgi:hypothetical protein